MPVSVIMSPDFGWSAIGEVPVRTWFKGYVMDGLRSLEGEAAAAHLRALLEASPEHGLEDFLVSLDGMFAFVTPWCGGMLAAVDRNCTVPLLYARVGDDWVVGDNGPALVRAMGGASPDLLGCLQVAMAAYCTGEKTVYTGLCQLRPGGCVILGDGGAEARRYYVYSPWEADDAAGEDGMRNRLRAVTEGLFSKLASDLAGRPVVAPLSAGLDSRLVVTGLLEAGHTNIRCFAYGLPNNYEARASKWLAHRLGLPWTFVPYSQARQRRMSRSRELACYLDRADKCASVPGSQDFLAIRELRDMGWLPQGAVCINGNSGDFITGAHVPRSLAEQGDAMGEAVWQDVLPLFHAKHYGMWLDLMTPANLSRIEAVLREVWRASRGPDDAPAHALWECLEWQGRQTSFVISLQRVYEFFGLSWRLPLWDNDYLNFWATVPVRMKLGQRLYREFLEQADWGGVWKGVSFRPTVSPAWIRPLRFGAKALCLPLGRNAWRTVDRRVFSYWTDILCSAGAFGVPYREYLSSGGGFRNGIAFRIRKYLGDKGLGRDGSPG